MTKRRRFLPVLTGLIVAAHACADRPATAPSLSRVDGTAHLSWDKKGFLPGSIGNANGNANSNGNGAPNGHALVCATHPTGTDSALIGPRGGQIAVGNNRLIVPPGALKDPVWIRMTVPEADAAAVELEPSGLVFKKPAGLQLDVEVCGVPPDYVPDVYYVSHDGEILERIPATYSNFWHAIAAAIDHFSGYIVAY